MKTIFHVGMPKAGSTALQESLLLSREYLRGCGILYPKNVEGVLLNNHRLLAQPFCDFNKLAGDVRRECIDEKELREKFLELASSIHNQVSECSPACLILSYENLWGRIADDAAPRVREHLGELIGAQPSAVIYFRRPSAKYLSGLQQGLKFARFRQPSKPNFKVPYARVQSIFGRHTITPIAFDRSLLLKGDIVHDFVERFLRAYGADPLQMEKPKRNNSSVSAAAMQLLDLYRIHEVQGKLNGLDVTTLRRNIVRAEERLELTRPKLKPEVSNMVDYCSTEPLWLRDQHGIEFPEFDYDRLEKGDLVELKRNESLSSLIDVDADEFISLVEDLERNGTDPNLRAWVLQFCSVRTRKSVLRRIRRTWPARKI